MRIAIRAARGLIVICIVLPTLTPPHFSVDLLTDKHVGGDID